MEYKILTIIFLISITLNYFFIKIDYLKDNRSNKQTRYSSWQYTKIRWFNNDYYLFWI